MTTRTVYSVKCECGHEGGIRLSENDQPYSACDERYELIDLRGAGVNFTRMADWPEVFEAMKPKCPMCHSKISHHHLVKG